MDPYFSQWSIQPTDNRRIRGTEEKKRRGRLTEPGGQTDGEPASLGSILSLGTNEQQRRRRVNHWQLVYHRDTDHPEKKKRKVECQFSQPSFTRQSILIPSVVTGGVDGHTEELHFMPEGAMEEC